MRGSRGQRVTAAGKAAPRGARRRAPAKEEHAQSSKVTWNMSPALCVAEGKNGSRASAAARRPQRVEKEGEGENPGPAWEAEPRAAQSKEERGVQRDCLIVPHRPCGGAQDSHELSGNKPRKEGAQAPHQPTTSWRTPECLRAQGPQLEHQPGQPYRPWPRAAPRRAEPEAGNEARSSLVPLGAEAKRWWHAVETTRKEAAKAPRRRWEGGMQLGGSVE